MHRDNVRGYSIGNGAGLLASQERRLLNRVRIDPPMPTKYVMQAYRAAVVVLTHIFILLIVILGVTVLDYAVAYASSFSGRGDALLIYGVVPLKWLFQTIDVALIITFGVVAVMDVIRIFRDE
jgi:hypothetical protein